MDEIQVTTKKWGNSIGVIIPKEIIDQIGIVENEKITVQFKKGHNIRDSFGILSDWKVTTDKIKAEMKKGWG